jgi:hypothetical protein
MAPNQETLDALLSAAIKKGRRIGSFEFLSPITQKQNHIELVKYERWFVVGNNGRAEHIRTFYNEIQAKNFITKLLKKL